MSRQVIVYEKDTLPEGVLICYTARLYVKGWSAGPLFESYLRGDHDKHAFKLAVMFEDTTPIAWVLKWALRPKNDSIKSHGVWASYQGSVWRYTLPAYRRQGIGKSLWHYMGGGRCYGDHAWEDPEPLRTPENGYPKNMVAY